MTHASQSPSSPRNPGSPTATIATGLSEVALKVLESRRISPELAVNLGWRNGKAGSAGEYRVEIPYYDENGVEVNFKRRCIQGEEDRQFGQKKDGRKCFYNLQTIAQWQKTEDALVITEGEFDCIAALQSGFMAVSVPDGAPAAEIHDSNSVKYSYLKDLPKKGTVILAVDNDPAGRNLFNDLKRHIGPHRCKWADMGEFKDLNEVLIAKGEDGVAEILRNAQWVKTRGNYLLSDLPPIPELYGTPLGFIPVTIRRGDFSVVTGIPNHGKSTVVNYLAYILAKQGWVTTFASFEQPPQTHHRKALRTLVSGHHPRSITKQELDKTDQWINSRFNFIVPDIEEDDSANLEWLMERMANAYFRYGTHLFVIDPWNEMEHEKGKEMTQTEYTGFAIKQLKKFATRYQVHVMVVAHPAKMQRAKGNGQYPVPSLYDIADSAHWANKSDLGMIVHRGEGINETIVKVQKSRYYEDIGEPGDYPLFFDPQTKTFTAMEAEYSCQ